MKKLLWLAAMLGMGLLVGAASAQNAALQGDCLTGGVKVTTQGALSSNTVMGSYPRCTVTVYLTGTSTPATIYSDSGGTPLSNPFTASTTGFWLFYALIGQGYDVVLSAGTPISFPSTRALTELFPGGGGNSPGVSEIIPGTNVTCSPLSSGHCVGNVTINSSGGGTGIPTSPTNALVKINGTNGAASSIFDDGTSVLFTEPIVQTSGKPFSITLEPTAFKAFSMYNSDGKNAMMQVNTLQNYIGFGLGITPLFSQFSAGAFATDTGSASQSGLTVTGSAGASFSPSYVGGILAYANGDTYHIVSYIDGTHLTVDSSATESTQGFSIMQPGIAIDSDGNVVIGDVGNFVSGNQSRLLVFGGVHGANVDVLPNANQADSANVEVEGSDYGTNSDSIAMSYVGPTTTGAGSCTLFGMSTCPNAGWLRIQGATTAAIDVVNNIPLDIGTNNARRMRIDGAGNVGIGTGTSSLTKLFNVGSAFNVDSSGNTIVQNLTVNGTCTGCGGSTVTLQTNSINNSLQTLLNLINSSTNPAGLTSIFANTSGGVVQNEISGTLNQAHGGTGINTSGSTGYPSIASGTWSVASTAATFITLYTTVATTAGDLLIGGPGGSPVRLAAASVGFLRTNGTGVAPSYYDLFANANTFTGQNTYTSIAGGNPAVNVATAGTATSGGNFGSPSLGWSGSIWNGTAGVADLWTANIAVTSGTNPASTLQINHASGTSGFASMLFNAPVAINGLSGTSPICANGTSNTLTTSGCIGASPTWNSITNPTGSQTLSMASNTSTWTYGAATGSGNLFTITDTASNTGTGNLVTISTASGSTENPFQVLAAGATLAALSVSSGGVVNVGGSLGTATSGANFGSYTTNLSMGSHWTGSVASSDAFTSSIAEGSGANPTVTETLAISSATSGNTMLVLTSANGTGATSGIKLNLNGSRSIQFENNGSTGNIDILASTMAFQETVQSKVFQSNLGSAQTSGNITITNWGTGAAVSAVAGFANTFRFTVTAGTTPSSNPTFSATLPTTFNAAPICEAHQTGGTSATSAYVSSGTETTTSTGNMTYLGLPVAASTYIFVVACGP